MVTRDEQHEIISFDDILERRCDTAPIEWIDEQLQLNGLDSAAVLANVQHIIARQEPKRPVRNWRAPIMFGSRVAAVLFGIPLAFAALDVPASLMIHEMRLRQSANIHSRNSLPIFTTDSVRGQFLDPRGPYALENFRENYYRANVPYGAIIYREARKNALPPELVAAMVHTESDFRPRLASQTAAHGLMQIVPSTAALLGIDEPLDPEQNIAAGTRYFRHLLNRYDDETLALAAYNAGETNVARFGGVPPFQETQEYIAKVNRRTHRYRDGVRNAYLANVKIRVDEPMQPQ